MTLKIIVHTDISLDSKRFFVDYKDFSFSLHSSKTPLLCSSSINSAAFRETKILHVILPMQNENVILWTTNISTFNCFCDFDSTDRLNGGHTQVRQSDELPHQIGRNIHRRKASLCFQSKPRHANHLHRLGLLHSRADRQQKVEIIPKVHELMKPILLNDTFWASLEESPMFVHADG
jgi:hypothetical protein